LGRGKELSDEAIKQQIQKELQHQKLSTKKIIKRTFFILLGAILMALGIEVFLVPNMIMDGGIVGISIILYNLTGIKLGVFIFLLNIPFFFLGFTQDVLLATVFGGIVLGAGVGLVIRFGGALDGSEILAILLNKKFPFSVGEFIMLFNVFIFAWGGFVLGWDRAMYSVLAYVIAFKTIDIVIDGFDESKSAWIISDKDKEIGNAILARLGRGVTYLKGEGGYSGDDKKVIFCIVTRLEEAKLKSIVEELDPTAFLAVADINEVRGGRFKKRDIH
jgi:uncharacterized membrane-anchored protein YitT (DUF2179 family)